MKNQTVVILGASDNPERYSYKAFKMLKEHGYEPILVSPRHSEIEGHPVYPDMKNLSQVDTVTVYVNSSISSSLKEELLKLNPRRVIFNPGSENLELMEELKKAGVEVEPACTLVLLTTGQF